MWALCPIRMAGRPGTLTPLRSVPGADSATWYHSDGRVWGRCGSPASSAPPPATAGPLAAQALLSGSRWIRPAGSASVRVSSVAAAVAVPADTGWAVAGWTVAGWADAGRVMAAVAAVEVPVAVA